MWYVKKEEIEQAEQELAVLKKARKEYWALEEIDNYNIQEAILILAESISKEFKALRG